MLLNLYQLLLKDLGLNFVLLGVVFLIFFGKVFMKASNILTVIVALKEIKKLNKFSIKVEKIE